ncbi:ABC transporter substrate-binding protein [Kineococcus sp. GCM10028916]|uniref:ABC transporter substrate-binding protein n=1 Tax=Kineococcus sp. GCM10028916 TaxID=3273394 RepID=UPI00362E90D4
MTSTTSSPSRRTVLGAGSLLGVGLVAACGSPGGSKDDSGSGGDAGATATLTLGLNRSLVSLDNKLNQFDAAVTVQRAVRQALTAIGKDLKPVPVLAESFEQTTDNEWTVKLRDGIVYSDGSAVTVEDVAKAIELYQQVEGSFVAQQFPEWPTVTKIDETSFTLTTQTPVVVLDSLMSNILITPAAANKAEELQDGVGTGPYVVSKSESGTGSYTLEINDNYWGDDKPTIPTVEVRFMPEESSRVVALRSGDVDVIDSVTADSVAQLKSVKDVEIDEVDGTRYNQLFYNFRKPAGHPLANPEVRRALGYAVDHDSIVTGIMGDSVTSATGVVPGTLEGAVEVGEFTYDPEKCKSELARLGVTNLALTIIWENGEFAGDASTMEALVEMFKAVGVTATLKQFEPGGDIGTWRRGEAGDWDILGNGYGNQTGLALTTIQGMYGGTPEKEATRDSYHGFVFPEIAAKISQASATSDEQARNGLLADVQQEVWDTWPLLWAFVPKALLARRSRVSGIDLKPINSYDITSVKLG